MAQARTPGLYGTNDPKKRRDGLLARQEPFTPGPVGANNSIIGASLPHDVRSVPRISKKIRKTPKQLPVLRVGSVGADVKKLQQLLNSRLLGVQLPLSGQFNQATRDAVIAFQKAKRLSVDGIVGQVTWHQLIVSTKRSVHVASKPAISATSGSAPPPAIIRSPAANNEPVWEWPLKEKLLEVVKRVPSRLPDEARREWNAFATPEGITETLLLIGAISLLSEGLALGVGILLIGFDTTRSIVSAISTTAYATNDDDLNAAADELAHVVISIGATVLLAGLLRFGERLSAPDNVGEEVPSLEDRSSPPIKKGDSRADVTNSEQQSRASNTEGSTGQSVKPESITYRQTVARRFYDTTGWSKEKITAHMAGIDFNYPVEVVRIPKGTEVVQYQLVGNPTGNYFAPVGTKAESLGINPVGRVANHYVATDDVAVLQSTAASTASNPSLPVSVRGGGGGTQYFAPQTSRFSLKP